MLYALADQLAKISIHALRVEGDICCGKRGAITCLFLSTPSGWRATSVKMQKMTNEVISIHALRVEGDGAVRARAAQRLVFLSTPSGWRATGRARKGRAAACISIHALRVEGDI